MISRAAPPSAALASPLGDDALLDAYSRTVIGALERVQQAVAFISVERRLPGDKRAPRRARRHRLGFHLHARRLSADE